MSRVEPELRIAVLGGFSVSVRGAPIDLPPSRKTRALLAYLAMTRRPQRREHLCELLWDVPDDPRGALRWSLSRLRAVLNSDTHCRIAADRDRVWLELDDVVVDIDEHRQLLDRPGTGPLAMRDFASAVAGLRQPLLAGLDLPKQPAFQAWLTALREEAHTIHCRLLMRLALDGDTPPDAALPWCREWFACDPLNPRAASALTRTLTRLGRGGEATEVARQFRSLAREAGVDDEGLDAIDTPDGAETPEAKLLQRQTISFSTTDDGVRIAIATVGRGPPLVKAANWLNHLELDWYSPIWAPVFRELARDYRFVRYDERGNGLSDWQVADLSFDALVRDLETVIDATTDGPVPLLGISQGCAVAIEYAARHPDRVSHLILWGGYAEGWRVHATAEERAEREAIFTLVRQGWGRADPAYRHLFSATFMPGANAEELDGFNDFQRATTSPDNAVRFLEIFADIDVRHRLGEIRVPTLVMHARGDRRVPLAIGGALAAGIAGAEFVALDSDNHLLLGREPASAAFIAHIHQFLAEQR
jgi:pimeloyl-ACP methyl ester carboxylesterase/DNA-binding SARP family transcriptional activator